MEGELALLPLTSVITKRRLDILPNIGRHTEIGEPWKILSVFLGQRATWVDSEGSLFSGHLGKYQDF